MTIVPDKMLTYKQAERKIRKEVTSPILIAGYVHNPKIPVKEFIENHLFNLVKDHTTIYEDGQYQTGTGRSRSLGDLWLITKYYYPSISLKRFRNILYSLTGLVGHYCSTVNKRVYRLSEDNWKLFVSDKEDAKFIKRFSAYEYVVNSYYYDNPEYRDEFGWLISDKPV